MEQNTTDMKSTIAAIPHRHRHTHTALIVILQANFGYSQLPCCSCLNGNLCVARCSSCCQHSMDLIVSLSITWLLKERNVIILLTMLTLKQVPSINTIRDVVLVSTSQSRDVVSKCLSLISVLWKRGRSRSRSRTENQMSRSRTIGSHLQANMHSFLLDCKTARTSFWMQGVYTVLFTDS